MGQMSCFEWILLWIIGTATLFLVVRDGVTRGIMKAWQKRDESRLREAVKAEQAAQAAAAAKRASRGSGSAGA